MDLYDFLNHATLGSPHSDPAYNQTGSSAWGWTDPLSGREFIGESKTENLNNKHSELIDCF